MNKLGYEPATLGVDQAKEKARAISSQIFDMIEIRGGKTTQPGPGISTCAEDPKHLYKVRHTWSAYGVSKDALSDGFDKLRERMPSNGWNITKYGPNDSPDKDLRILADSTKEQFTANIELLDATKPGSAPSASKESGIMVTLVSACFRAPEDTDLSGEY
ncbi:hypothetical protein ACMATS_26935 [Streptoverticillium reticulum]|uniref:hypothetical protein n=1 Tax=Streptoverticillium reticulum TaxID=1433415 RepID=UPI0039BF5B6E